MHSQSRRSCTRLYVQQRLCRCKISLHSVTLLLVLCNMSLATHLNTNKTGTCILHNTNRNLRISLQTSANDDFPCIQTISHKQASELECASNQQQSIDLPNVYMSSGYASNQCIHRRISLQYSSSFSLCTDPPRNPPFNPHLNANSETKWSGMWFQTLKCFRTVVQQSLIIVQSLIRLPKAVWIKLYTTSLKQCPANNRQIQESIHMQHC